MSKIDVEPSAGTVEQPEERVFVRQATGLVRAMSGNQALIYNILVSGVLLNTALGLLWIPYAFPGANMWLGALLTGLLGAFVIGAYAILGDAALGRRLRVPEPNPRPRHNGAADRERLRDLDGVLA
jgi:hypothetical protein